MNEKATYKNWSLEEKDNIVRLFIDVAGSAANILSSEVLEELDTILKELASAKPKGLIILSAKTSGFIAGADIREFITLEDKTQATVLIGRGQDVFNRLEKLQFPTVCLIHGFCLGGGLELALACNYRVGLDDVSTRLGLPEVKLGIHPGFGGTVRLQRLIGAPKAMELILSGKTIDVRRAKKMGLIDYTVAERHLVDMGEKCINEKLRRYKPSMVERLSNSQVGRPIIKKILLKKTEARIRPEHYPAPFAAIDLYARGGRKATQLKREAESVANLITGSTAKNLINLFFLSERLKSLGKSGVQAPSRVHVIGAGIMGGDIAAWCALKGHQVTLQDTAPQSIAATLKRAAVLYKKRLRNPRLVRNTMDYLMPDTKGAGLARADIIIEAVFEDVTVKRDIFKEIEPQLRDDVVIATNTSSIPLEDIADALNKPDRLVGMHFFNPVAKMELVEIIAGETTNQESLKKALAFIRGLGRLPLPVKSSPLFLVNRVLMPYLLEAVMMVKEGKTPEEIDQAATLFGMPVGPVTLADMVGLDICHHVGETMKEKFGITVPGILGEKVASGHIGRKSGRGFYTYKKGKPIKAKSSEVVAIDEEIQERLIFRMLNESMTCLDEKIVEDADLLDAGMVFGAGFAPFRGGPMRYCRDKGYDTLLARLKNLEDKFGERFSPAAGWDK